MIEQEMYGAAAIDRRLCPRKMCYTMFVDYATTESIRTEPARDISRSGLFIETFSPLPVGKHLSMIFRVPYERDFIQMTGQVVRADHEGFAVSFNLLKSKAHDQISNYVSMEG